MGNKYYTPEISEFHIGFEFEEKGYSRKEEWSKLEIDTSDFCSPNIGEACESNFQDILRKLDIKEIRVKYLDKKDIESLHWEYSDLYEKFTLNNYTLYFTNAINMLVITKLGINIYVGYIKNKSELKKLMKQLGI